MEVSLKELREMSPRERRRTLNPIIEISTGRRIGRRIGWRARLWAKLILDREGYPVGLWGGAVRGWALAHLVACPPGAVLMLWIGKPLPAIILAVGFAAAVAVLRQEMCR